MFYENDLNKKKAQGFQAYVLDNRHTISNPSKKPSSKALVTISFNIQYYLKRRQFDQAKIIILIQTKKSRFF